MIATNSKLTSCPSGDEIRAFRLGELPESRFGKLLDHIDHCRSCQQGLECDNSASDWLVSDLRQPAELISRLEFQEPECLGAVLDTAQRTAPNRRGPHDGTMLGPYRLIRPLGIGGMSTVFLAEHTRLKRAVAIKLLACDHHDAAAWQERFEREMATVAALEHANIVRATDAGEADGWHFLVMEYLDGLDLSSVLQRLGPLPIADACQIAIEAAAGLDQVHSLGWVHRDVKPSNLMVTRDGTTKLLDLGLVLSNPAALSQQHRLTTVGHLMGTVAFMAPEQLVDSCTVDHRADLYALAATLFRLLTGEDPHRSRSSLPATILAKTTEPARSLKQLRDDLPDTLADAIDQGLAKAPKERQASIQAFSAQLAEFADDADLAGLVRRAQTQPPTRDELLAAPATALPGTPPLPGPRTAEAGGDRVDSNAPSSAGSGGRVAWRWLAAAFLPWFVLLAGIVIILQTDRGELVIESPVDQLAVRVHKGEQLVERLELSSGENRTTLRSGTYAIELDTVTDGWALSGDRITVTRGGEEVLSIEQRAMAKTSSAATDDGSSSSLGPAPLYGGKPFESWLQTIKTERELDRVRDAMYAAARLVVTQSQREALAGAMLAATRSFTDVMPPSSGLGTIANEFPVTMPDAGIMAMVAETDQSNPNSCSAIIWLLSSYVQSIPLSGQKTDFAKPFRHWISAGATAEQVVLLQRILTVAVGVLEDQLGVDAEIRGDGEKLADYLHGVEASDTVRTIQSAFVTQLEIGRLANWELGELTPAVAYLKRQFMESQRATLSRSHDEVEVMMQAAEDGRWPAVESILAMATEFPQDVRDEFLMDLYLLPAEIDRGYSTRLQRHAQALIDPLQSRSAADVDRYRDALINTVQRWRLTKRIGPFSRIKLDSFQYERWVHLFQLARDSQTALTSEQREFFHALVINATIQTSQKLQALKTALGELLDDTASVPSKQSDTEESGTEQSEPSSFANQPMTRSLFQGQPFSHWIDVMSVERDAATLGRAMEALQQLAQTDQQRREAADAILVAARTFGGYVTSGLGSSTPPSHVFMHYFNEAFPYWMPTPGIAAVANELLQQDVESTKAATWALTHYVSGYRPEGMLSTQREDLKKWAADPANRNQLEALVRASRVAIETLGGVERYREWLTEY